MATYVALLRFTEQGARNIRETRERADAFRASAEQSGVTVREQFWTIGSYDGLLVLDAPDEQTVTAVLLELAALGNVRTQTLRAFDADEMEALIGRTRGGGARSAGGSQGGARAGGKPGGGSRGGRR